MIPTPLPRVARFEKLAYGLFLHWGLYSLLGRGEWAQSAEEISVEEYAKLKDSFTAEDFDARAIARFARECGMKYITLTTRHHDGFSLYDTRGLSDFDAPHSPAGRDLVAEFVEGCRAEGIVPFFYHTTLDWRWDTANCSEERFNEYLEYLNASVEVLCKHYGPIGGLWFDGNWSRNIDWKEDALYATIRRHQPEAMIINNTGLGAQGGLGHPEIDSTTFEQGLPVAPNREGWPKYLAGEMCKTMNSHWGIAVRDYAYMSPAQIIEQLAACRKVGANYLLNVGPTAGGAIPPYEEAALRRVGEWVAANGAALYEGKPVKAAFSGRDFVLEAPDGLYYFAHDLGQWGSEHVVATNGSSGLRAIAGLNQPIHAAHWIDGEKPIAFTQDTEQGIIALNLEAFPYGVDPVVRVAKLEKGAA